MPIAVDVFSGCGGLTTGLERAGFNVVGAIEINSIAAETYRMNHPNTHLINKDVRDVKSARLMRELGLRKGQLDLLAGCSPCQGFSRLRKGNSGANDKRNYLVFEFLRLVRGLFPKTILMENVPGLLKTPQGRKIYEVTCAELDRMGYQVDCKIIDTVDYGIPQFRKRCVLLGSRYRRHTVLIPARTHVSPEKASSENLPSWRTVRQTIGELPALKNGEIDAGNPLHRCSENGKLVRKRIAAIPHDGGSRADLPQDLVLQCHVNYPDGFRDVYGRMSWDRPAPTMTGGCTNISKGRFIHPDEDRGISLLEAALFQTFPSDYRFAGSFANITLQIGNAVPVELGRVMGEELASCLRGIEHGVNGIH